MLFLPNLKPLKNTRQSWQGKDKEVEIENVSLPQVGEDGAGHFVKMVHNGIEYGDMQLICEAYHLMKDVLKMDNDEMSAGCLFVCLFVSIGYPLQT